MRPKYNDRIHYSNEYYLKANDLSLYDYASKHGHSFKKEGSEYRCTDEGYRSLLINPQKNTFFWNKEGTGGGTVKFAMVYENLSRDEAIEKLLGSDVLLTHSQHLEANNIPKEKDKEPFALPPKSGDYKRLFAYLNKTRGIDYDTIRQFVDLEKIYQEKEYGNIVFVATDETGVARAGKLKGTNPDYPFAGDIPSSEKKHPFCLEGETNRLYVYEADIDLMSDITLTKLKGFEPKAHHRISTGGNANSDPLFYYLEKNPQIDEVVFRLDNDIAGKNGVEKMGGKLLAMRKKVHVLFPVHGDVNEDLQECLKEQQQTNAEEAESEL